jgi:hypothetical protein
MFGFCVGMSSVMTPRAGQDVDIWNIVTRPLGFWADLVGTGPKWLWNLYGEHMSFWERLAGLELTGASLMSREAPGRTDDQRKPGAALWVAEYLVAAALFLPATFGPAVWSASRGLVDTKLVGWVYRPMLWADIRAPEVVNRAITWWAETGIPSDRGVQFLVPTSEDGDVMVAFGRLPFGVGRTGGIGIVHIVEFE